MSTEADTFREFVVPKLQAAGWDNDQSGSVKVVNLDRKNPRAKA